MEKSSEKFELEHPLNTADRMRQHKDRMATAMALYAAKGGKVRTAADMPQRPMTRKETKLMGSWGEALERLQEIFQVNQEEAEAQED